MLGDFKRRNDFFEDPILPAIFSRLCECREDVAPLIESSDEDRRTKLSKHFYVGFAGSNPADISECNGNFVLRIDAPGINPENVDIRIFQFSALVSWENGADSETTSEDKDGAKYILRERSSSSFRRKFAFPKKVEPKGATATFDAGVLTVTVPIVKEDEGISVKIGVGNTEASEG